MELWTVTVALSPASPRHPLGSARDLAHPHGVATLRVGSNMESTADRETLVSG